MLERIQDGELVAVLIIDISTAFDMVDHQFLLQNLRLCGHEKMGIKWMESYLQVRETFITFNKFSGVG